ncbi:N-acetyltransferase family protein [Sodalis sp. RH24]|uniref:GNAT family N-acetyltransferase n=1 Tax=unclassified Sodalis (in: enterobacteria) TaxID=2636512 RepID=UPI0039B5DE3D
MDVFTVRRVTRNHVGDFRYVRLEALRLYPEAFGASFADESQKPDEFFAERLLLNTVFGGFDLHNRLQGIIGISFSTVPKLSHVATFWGMYVRAELRGSGLSRALLAAALQAVGTVRTVKLSVVSTNRPAQALYRSVGFKEWATDTAALCVDGVFHDELLMRLDFAPAP